MELAEVQKKVEGRVVEEMVVEGILVERFDNKETFIQIIQYWRPTASFIFRWFIAFPF